ncbi:M1 family peptidase [Periweissella cryptocerci]|uniref:Aminopeptidase n=1 Tax=Periweissella cryptocerci TaxID=2506420 RepID=A0A4P6YS94_9LACO|nr:M1 family metallopeptidase [Periweissella cryptocerci]QBO35547.1 M1 family peptidase [Periweissella cryptocerci]
MAEEFTHFITTFVPEHYAIELDINRATKTFGGHTTITGEALQTTVLIHQRGLKIGSVLVNGQPAKYHVDNTIDGIVIEVPTTGIVTFDIDYTATLTDTLMGIYPSYYEVDGIKKQVVLTQFESSAAREAFPSVDEPEAKAIFDIAIKFDEQPGETILGNMPEIDVIDGYHRFATTVRMSTYLIAFGFGELQGKTITTTSGVQVGVFATKAHAPAELDFSLDIAKRSIEFFEEYYQTPYPLPHSWQLAVPDFSFGAMENWGLVIYRESALLLDPANSSLDTKHRVATVVAHELAHQWFGDLVTMKWWDDLWLNESFANMMEYVAIDSLQPDWNIWESFQMGEVPMSLARDATDGVQSVHVEVKHPDEVNTLFDSAIVYAKGARMLVMARAMIGDAALRTGLKAYFAKHKYGNTIGEDLWTELSAASGQDVNAVMQTYLEQPGYPVVDVQVEEGQLVLTQQQFFIGAHKDSNRQWQIPLNGNYVDAAGIMTTQKLVVGDYAKLRKAAGEPFRLNIGNNSHFIVNYADDLLADIIEHADDLDDISKLQLLADMRLLAEGQQSSYAKIVPLLKRFADSESILVQQAITTIIGNLKKFVEPESSAEKRLQKLTGELSAGQVTRLGWTAKADDTNDDTRVRPLVLGAALYAENEVAVQKSHNLFAANRENLVSLPAHARALILRNEIVNYGSFELFEQLLDIYKHATDPSFKTDLSIAIPYISDNQAIEKIVALFQDNSVVKPQDLPTWYNALLGNAKGQQAAWDWARKEWDWIDEKLGGSMNYTAFVKLPANAFRTKARLTEFKAFFAPKLAQPNLTREITMGTEVIASRVELIANQAVEVNAAIAKAITE